MLAKPTPEHLVSTVVLVSPGVPLGWARGNAGGQCRPQATGTAQPLIQTLLPQDLEKMLFQLSQTVQASESHQSLEGVARELEGLTSLHAQLSEAAQVRPMAEREGGRSYWWGECYSTVTLFLLPKETQTISPSALALAGGTKEASLQQSPLTRSGYHHPALQTPVLSLQAYASHTLLLLSSRLPTTPPTNNASSVAALALFQSLGNLLQARDTNPPIAVMSQPGVRMLGPAIPSWRWDRLLLLAPQPASLSSPHPKGSRQTVVSQAMVSRPPPWSSWGSEPVWPATQVALCPVKHL